MEALRSAEQSIERCALPACGTLRQWRQRRRRDEDARKERERERRERRKRGETLSSPVVARSLSTAGASADPQCSAAEVSPANPEAAA